MLPFPWSIAVITPPAAEPITIDQAKAHLRVDSGDENALITALIIAARERAEGHTGRALITQTLELTLDEFPGSIIEIPRAPVLAITSVKAINTANAETTMSADDYLLDIGTGRLSLADDASWPDVTLRPIGGVKVRFTAGYGTDGSAVPAVIRQAMLLMIGHWFTHREEAISGVTIAEVPLAAKALLDMERGRWV